MEFINLLTAALFENWLIIIAFFVIAILYSSVGFGGGSSYLAVLSLFGVPYIQMRAIALICNITVVSGNIFRFLKNKQFNWTKVLPIALLSIPFAFLGGKIKVENEYLIIFLAFTLIIASFFMLIANYVKNNSKESRANSFKDFSYGAIVGFVSGLVGVGGGVFLAPLLHLTKWDTPKKIAAASSLFIFVNSISGLFGQAQNPNFTFDIYLTTLLIITVFIGGQIGSRMREKIISPIVLKRMTAVLIFFVGLRLLLKHLL